MFAAFPWPDYEMWSQCQALLPHARAILEYKPAKKKDALKWLEISGATGMYLMHRGEFAASEARHRAAFELSEQVSGLNNKRTLTCLNNLAVTMVGKTPICLLLCFVLYSLDFRTSITASLVTMGNRKSCANT